MATTEPPAEQTALVLLRVTGEPKGQPRPRAVKRGNHAAVYDPGTAENWKQAVRAEAMTKATSQPLGLPMVVHITYFMPRPQSHYGSGKNANRLKPSAPTHHTTKPDVDNLNKAIMDALSDVELWRDDSLVAEVRAVKRYCEHFERQGCEIRIYEAEQTDSA